MNGHGILKQVLVDFWNRFGGRKKLSSGNGFDPKDKILALKELSNFIIPYKKQRTLNTKRSEFESKKYHLHSIKRFGLCFVCGNPASARHHIVQLQNGGINSKKNLVSLCDTCHSEIHPWLKTKPPTTQTTP